MEKKMYPKVKATVPRTVTIDFMMYVMFKVQEKLFIMVKDDGPIEKIIADSNTLGKVCDYVHNPHIHLLRNDMSKLNVVGAVSSEGFIDVFKFSGMKEPHPVSIPIISGELETNAVYLQGPIPDSMIKSSGSATKMKINLLGWRVMNRWII